MKSSYTCVSIKELNNVFKRIRSKLFTDIDCVYNLGRSQYYEYPLFLFTKHHVFRLYYSDNELDLEIFEREHFCEQCHDSVFREFEHPQEFDYVYPEAYYPNAKICDVLVVRGCGTEKNLKGIDLIFSDGRHLCVRESELVRYTMDSWITE